MGTGIRVQLITVAGPLVGKQMEVQTGYRVRVGRTDQSHYALPEDQFLSGVQFSLECNAQECILRDSSRNGTFLNGSRVRESMLRDGDQIVGGQTTFTVRVGALEPNDLLTNLIAALQAHDQPLFAIVDAARDVKALAAVRQSGEYYESLFDGKLGAATAEAAPYLIAIPKNSPLLGTLLRMGWGRSWGVYFNSFLPFSEARKHLRRFLMVRSDDGREMYFRFYDPRVLRVFLPTCTVPEAMQFFGALSCYMMEAEDPKRITQFNCTPDGLVQKTLDLQQSNAPVGERLTA
jgi:hypothetical protein